MLGGGNPVSSSNPSGIGTGLNYIGEHAYATSGSIADTDAQQTMLKFTTANSYVIGKFSFFGSTIIAQTAGGISTGNVSNFEVIMDGQTVAVVKTDTAQEDMPAEMVIPMLLPPYAKIEIKVVSAAAASTYATSVTFVGRVYN